MAESEIELKLSLAETEVSRFRRDTILHRMKRARAVSRALLAVYFDTPGL
jgi:inorganic triphosphatase YgiF